MKNNNTVQGQVQGQALSTAPKAPKTPKSAVALRRASEACDPEMVSFLSEVIEDVYFNPEAEGDDETAQSAQSAPRAAADFRSFGSRVHAVSEATAAAKTGTDAVLTVAVHALRTKIESGYRKQDFKAIVRSPAGMRTLLDISTALELRAYCQLLGTTGTDLAALTGGTRPATHFSNLPLLTAIGIWSQNAREEAARGLGTVAAVALADQAFAALGELESFKFGRNFAKRTWDGPGDTEVRRGRKAAGHMDRLFTSDAPDAADENAA